MNDNWTRIKAHLQAQGYMDENGLTRRVTAKTCTDCHAPVLAALDADVCAFSVHVDPAPLSVVGEALAVITGRRTYALRRLGGRHLLSRRSSFAIAGSPAGSARAARYDVLADHACAAGPLPTIPSAYQPTTAAAELFTKGAPCPF